jgi:hypothetical protein
MCSEIFPNSKVLLSLLNSSLYRITRIFSVAKEHTRIRHIEHRIWYISYRENDECHS